MKPAMGIVVLCFALLLTSGAALAEDAAGVFGEITREYECARPVTDRDDALRCFNAYFEEKRTVLEQQRGAMPAMVREMLQNISKDDLFLHEGSYQISRNGSGTPYFLKDGVIYINLE